MLDNLNQASIPTADLEKVIKGLENAWKYLDIQRRTYESVIRGTIVTCFDDTLNAIDGALALLKAQEPVKPERYEGTCYCGNCGDPINMLDNYCHECGRAVKWE